MSNDNNFDALLDVNLDDLSDLPEFTNFPAGVHRCTVSIISKTINNKPAMEVSLTGIETVELSKPEEDKPITAGQVSSAAYFLGNELGQGQLKKLIAPLAAYLGETSLRGIMESATGTEVEAVTGFRTNKKTGAIYFQINKLIVG